MGIGHYAIADIASKNPMDMLKNYREIKSIIKKERITLVHAHHRMAAFYAELCAPKGVTKVANAHNTFTDKKKLTQFAYRDTRVIAVGERVRENLTGAFWAFRKNASASFTMPSSRSTVGECPLNC